MNIVTYKGISCNQNFIVGGAFCMNNIQDISKQPIVEWEGQTVITTAQLAKVYGATKDNISDNFNRNKDRFTEGKHYILLTGEELKEFKSQSAESGLVAKTASQLYLWTRRGASRHCKILGTDKAWEQFDYLEENYFDRQEQKQQTLPLTLQQQIQTIAKGTDELYHRVDEVTEDVKTVKQEIEALKDDLPLFPNEAEKISNAAKKKGVEVLGGKQSNAYKDKSLQHKVYTNIYANLKYNFKVSSYKSIKRGNRYEALRIVEEYKPPYFLAEQIANINAQQTLDLEGGAIK